MNLSVVIPVFNEARRLPRALAICRKNPDWEFIFVDDGSTDATAAMIKTSGFKLTGYAKNKGKGNAIKQGVKLASRPFILITDVDFSTPLTELPKLVKKDADIVIGSRKTSGAQITRHQPFWREWLGKQFTTLANLWLGINVSDVTCGFKLFKAPVAKKLLALSKINRWGYDAEILFLAKKLNYSLAEVPVVWHNDSQSKVSVVKDILLSLKDLWIIKWTNYEI